MNGNSWTADEIQLIAQRAYDLHLQGKNFDALQIFAGLVAIDPQNVYCLDALTALSLALNQPEQALHYASALLRTAPHHTEAIARRCEANIRLHRLEDAQRDLELLKQAGATTHYNRMNMRVDAARRQIEGYGKQLRAVRSDN
jgi:predicted Zn-dependent protease